MTASVSTEQLWRERVRGWREAGGSAEAYAKGRGFSGSALRMWGGRLSPRGGTASPRIVALVPRGTAPATTSTAAGGELIIEVGGARIRVAAGFDRALLAEVIGALGSAR